MSCIRIDFFSSAYPCSQSSAEVQIPQNMRGHLRAPPFGAGHLLIWYNNVLHLPDYCLSSPLLNATLTCQWLTSFPGSGVGRSPPPAIDWEGGHAPLLGSPWRTVCSETQVIPKGRGLPFANTGVLDSSWLLRGKARRGLYEIAYEWVSTHRLCWRV